MASTKQESRARILESAGRGFRAHGFGGLGIDGLAKNAGVTSGAFYAHFPSKAAAFREAAMLGMADLRDGIRRFRDNSGEDWLTEFVAFYMGERRTCEPGEACALQALSGDVARADDATRADYQRILQEIIAVMAEGLASDSPTRRDQDAIALLAMLAGAVTIARAVPDQALGANIAAAVRDAAGRLVES